MGTNVWSENLKGRDHSEDIDTDGRIMHCILRKWDWKDWTGFVRFMIGTGGGLL
jgi:hypothetical protein